MAFGLKNLLVGYFFSYIFSIKKKSAIPSDKSIKNATGQLGCTMEEVTQTPCEIL
jgi:hypothetical protein